MNVIDMHTHVFPDSLAERAVRALEEPIDWKAAGDGTLGGLRRSMGEAGVDVSVICSIATKPKQVAPIFEWCRDVVSPDIVPLPSVHPETPDAEEWIRKFAEAGMPGVKLHPMYQEFALDESRMDRLYDALTDHDLIVEIHTGFDIAFGDDDSASVERLMRVIGRHPKMRLVCTHLGAWKAWDQVESQLLGTGVFMETSFSLDWAGLEVAERVIRGHGTDRVMFGTDWPWTNQREQVGLLRSLGLSESEKQAILWENAAGLLGISPSGEGTEEP
jgi:uncharacterized protein